MHGFVLGAGVLLLTASALLGRAPSAGESPAAGVSPRAGGTSTPAGAHGDLACAACHGSSGEPAAASVPPTACLGCHEAGHVALFPDTAHGRGDVGCAACHAVHRPQRAAGLLSATSEAALCQRCHAAVRARFLRASRHPISDEGPLSCGSCHDPHGSTADALLRSPTVNETCQACHAETRGPFVWEHAPATEDCGTCHEPHGSSHRPLLVSRVPWLCQRCHVGVQHQGALFDRANTGGEGPFARAPEHACARCHRAVHGSNHPSGAALER